MECMYRQTNERTDERTVIASNQCIFLNIDIHVLMVICVKFHHDRTSASLKSNLTKHSNLNGMDEQTDERTDGQTDNYNLKSMPSSK